MLHVDDDMDELFRKAADEYQLNTDGGNFEEILSKLDASSNANLRTARKKNSNNKKFFLLLLLLPLGWLCYEYYPPSTNRSVENNTAALKTLPGDDKNRSAFIKPAFQDNPTDKKETSLSKNNNDVVENKTPSHTWLREHRDLKQIQAINTNKKQKLVTLLNRPSTFTDAAESNRETLTTIPEIFTKEPDKYTYTGEAGSKTNIDEIKEPKLLPKPEIKKTTATGSSIAKPIKPGVKARLNKISRLYAGIVGGVDLSMVQYQAIKDQGFNAGALLGYQLERSLSVEVMLLYDKKSYYTNAKSFDNSEAYLSNFSNLKNLDGHCKMIELALSAKYDFATSKKSGWFATAGVSSYFMKNEEYTYFYGGSTPYSKSLSYNKKHNQWLAATGIGIGYQRSVANKLMLRIEPYFKIPLRGIGTGKLPITSSGVNIAITRNL